MVDLSPYMVTGTNDPTKQISVTKWNGLLTDLETGTGADVTLNLTPSLVPSSIGTNSASAINALIAALPRGGVVQFPSGHYIFDGKIDITKRITARGQGPGIFGDDASAATLLEFPAGSTGFRIHHIGGKNSRCEAMRVIQTSLLSTSVTASYTAGATTITLAAAGDFQNGQVVQLDGAGQDVIMSGRLFTTTVGSAVVTWTDADGIFRGNSPGYNGMEIAIAGAGFAAGTYIVSWGIGTATLSGNAASSVSNALATLTTPIITEIVSGGGTTTLTIADVPVTTKSVTNRKLSHAAPAIYSSTQCHTRDFEAFSECQIAMVLAGITTGGAVADNGTFLTSYFAGTRFGVVLQGADAQVNSFFGCNFAGPEIGVLDQSFLGNYFYGCHWAFNMGILVVDNGGQTQIIGGYFESGTSFICRADGSCIFFGTVSMVPGYGWKGFGVYATELTASQLDLWGPITAKDDLRGTNIGGHIDGGFWASGTRPAYFTGNMNNVPGVPGTNSGIALGNSLGGAGGINTLASFDNIGTGTMRELALQASQFRIGNTPTGSQFGTWDTTNGIRWRLPLGYDNGGNGVGGAITQITSRTTGVTLNKATGAITLFSAAGLATWQSFTVTNSLVAANDTIRVCQQSGTDLYQIHVTNVAAGSFKISYATTGGTTTEQPVFNFTVMKGANS